MLEIQKAVLDEVVNFLNEEVGNRITRNNSQALISRLQSVFAGFAEKTDKAKTKKEKPALED